MGSLEVGAMHLQAEPGISYCARRLYAEYLTESIDKVTCRACVRRNAEANTPNGIRSPRSPKPVSKDAQLREALAILEDVAEFWREGYTPSPLSPYAQLGAAEIGIAERVRGFLRVAGR